MVSKPPCLGTTAVLATVALAVIVNAGGGGLGGLGGFTGFTLAFAFALFTGLFAWLTGFDMSLAG